MPFTPVTYNTGAAPGLDGPAFNAMQQQYPEAVLSFEPFLFTAFVLTGLVATKDGTTPSQLDVTAGTAFLQQTDNTLRQRQPTSTTFSVSGHPSTTMFLDLNPDGTYSWATTHSGVANYLPIASVTTDASANIVTVTDARTLNTTLLSSAIGALTLPKLLQIVFGAVLSSANKLIDLMQSYGLFSDNTGTKGTTRTWLDGPDRDEFHMGPRSSSVWFDWIRARATRVTVELGRNTSPNATLFEVIGGPTQLDNNGISTDGNGNLTVTGKVIYNHTLGGANQVLLSLFPTDGAKEWRINYNADSTISFFDATDGKVALKLLTSGGILTDNGAITTDGAGNLSATSLKEGTTRVAVQGAHSAGQPIISYCVGGPPATLAANEICIQLS